MKVISNKFFFDVTSKFYDEMINFDQSLQKRRAAFQSIIPAKVKTIADLGCGSGIDSIALSQLGYKVTAFDISDGMIEKAKKNALEKDQTIEFNNFSLDKIPSSFDGQFDFVCSLGNTFANLDKAQLKQSIERIFDLLNNGGTYLIHIINYEKLLSEKNRILNITNKNGNYYIRFYDFEKEHIVFNILSFDEDTPSSRSLVSTKIYPHSSEEIKNTLNQKNNNYKTYGSMYKELFNSELSKDLFILGKK